MRKNYKLLLFSMFFVPSVVVAQNKMFDVDVLKNKGIIDSDTVPIRMNEVENGSADRELLWYPYIRDSYFDYDLIREDSLRLPMLASNGRMFLMGSVCPSWCDIDTWQLHKGLNMNIGASVFASFGKGAPKGAGFANNISLMYAMPLSKRVSLAVGGWIGNVYWTHDRSTDAGLSAVLGYKINEHWEAYVYGHKSLVNSPKPYCYCTMQELGDRIGAAVKYNFSPNFSVQVSVDAVEYKMPNRTVEPPTCLKGK